MKMMKKTERVGKYELERVLGEGNYGKVRYGKNVETGQGFAVKILDKNKINSNHTHKTDQIKREIATLKMLKHPNIVRVEEVLASKIKIYMVLEYVSGGELYERILKGRLSEGTGRKIFQQLIDAVSYCHNKGVYHRDLKLENVLIDATGNVKLSDFGLCALPHHFRGDGLLHTVCGSPNYVAPEVISNKEGYNGASSDLWSCGVILYAVLIGHLPFDDRYLTILYQKILEGDTCIPEWVSSGAKNMISRLLDPNPETRITMNEIKEDEWFKQDYIPANPIDEDHDAYNIYNDETFTVQEVMETKRHLRGSLINAFELIGMSSSLDLSGLFEKEDVKERKIRFITNYCLKDLLIKIEGNVKEMGFRVQKRNGKLRLMQEIKDQKSPLSSLSIAVEIFEINSSLLLVELNKSHGDSSVYRKLCLKLSNELSVGKSHQQLTLMQT